MNRSTSDIAQATAPLDHRTATPLHVLLVEDDTAFAEFLLTALSGSGHVDLRLTRVGRLRAALEAVHQDGLEAVLLDLNLPDSRGLATLTQITTAAPHMAVVVLTGVDDARLATEALRRGAQDWLTKGHLDPELVHRAIRYAIERKRLEDRLLRSQKLEAVGRLAGTVAHEFNNLLTVVLANADLVIPAVNDAVAAEALREISRAAERGATLTQQLLGFARKQPAQPRAQDVADLVAETVTALRPVLAESIALEVGPTLENGHVRIDRGQFEQVLLNLAINARDAMPGGGVLTIRTRRAPFAESGLLAAAHARGTSIVVEVSDTGTGIAADVLPHIFEPFFSTKQDRGTGLGLAMCEEILVRSGGALRVRSVPGQGTTFVMYLPEIAAAHEGERAKTEGSAVQGSGTILVVDDEVMVRSAIAPHLRRAGWQVLEAGTSADALALGAAHQGTIDLLLTDVVMPQMRGPELAHKLSCLRPELRVLFMSGYTDDVHGDMKSVSEAEILRKPFAPRVLVQRVHDFLKERGES